MPKELKIRLSGSVAEELDKSAEVYGGDLGKYIQSCVELTKFLLEKQKAGYEIVIKPKYAERILTIGLTDEPKKDKTQEKKS